MRFINTKEAILFIKINKKENNTTP